MISSTREHMLNRVRVLEVVVVDEIATSASSPRTSVTTVAQSCRRSTGEEEVRRR